MGKPGTWTSPETDIPQPDGVTYKVELDYTRLKTLFDKVNALMIDHQWRTLEEIKATIKSGSESGISARLRDHRKLKFGGFKVERRRRGNPSAGLFEYRVGPPSEKALSSFLGDS